MTGEYERIRPALKEAACLLQTWLEAEQEPDRLHDWYALHKKLEYLLYDIGGVIYDLEVRSDEALAPEQEALPLNPTEKKVFRDYLTRFQVGAEPFLFEPYANGYRAVLPYLLNRRASERVYYSPKRKYVVNVFETLLRKNRSTIKRMPAVTVFIVTCAPYREVPPRDNDNADARDIINLIKNYLMNEDDSGLYLNVFYDTRIAQYYHTEVYVLPRLSYLEILNQYPAKTAK